MEAINNTIANKYFKIFWLNLLAPNQAPNDPPTKATPTKATMPDWNSIPFVSCPASPDIEFTKMNNALMAAVCFWFVQASNNNTGDRMIPPPMPINPDKNPMQEIGRAHV